MSKESQSKSAKRSRARFFTGDWGKRRDEMQSDIDFPTINSALKAFQKRPKKPTPPEPTLQKTSQSEPL